MASPSFSSTRAIANVRLGRYDVAAAHFRELVALDRSPGTFANLARSLACAERWDAALTTLAEADRIHPRDPQLAALREPITQGRMLAGAAAADRDPRARARIWYALGAADLVRRELAPAPSDDPETVVLLALADALDGDVQGARRTLIAARTRDPEHAATWNAALVELSRIAAPAPSGSGLDALFR